MTLEYQSCMCKKPQVITGIFTGVKYRLNQFWCTYCSTWIDEKGTYLSPSGRRCTCCKQRVRESPRQKVLKEKFRNE